MKTVGELRQQAERFRRLNRQISDPAAVQAICELASEFEMTAAELRIPVDRDHRFRSIVIAQSS
jgi:hypothetical protein